MRRIYWLAILAAFWSVVSGSLVATGINGHALFSEWHKPLEKYWFLTLAGMIIIFIVSAFFIYRFTKKMFIRTLSRESCEPHQVLIAFLSTPYPRPLSFCYPLKFEGYDIILEGNDLKADIGKLNKFEEKGLRWNWKQLMRALDAHKERLKHVYLIGSCDTEGKIVGECSFKEMMNAKKLVTQYCPDVEDVSWLEEPVDFEDFETMQMLLRRAIEQFTKSEFHEKDIIIDITGGMKPCSVAGAVVTLDNQVKFQYLTTVKGKDICWAYDSVIQTPSA